MNCRGCRLHNCWQGLDGCRRRLNRGSLARGWRLACWWRLFHGWSLACRWRLIGRRRLCSWRRLGSRNLVCRRRLVSCRWSLFDRRIGGSRRWIKPRRYVGFAVTMGICIGIEIHCQLPTLRAGGQGLQRHELIERIESSLLCGLILGSADNLRHRIGTVRLQIHNHGNVIVTIRQIPASISLRTQSI